MKFLFVAPRMHTNQIGVIQALLSNHHDVIFHVLLQGHTESYTTLKPDKIEATGFSRLISRLRDTQRVNSPSLFPSPIKYYSLVKAVAPDFVVVRDPSRFFSLVAAICARFLDKKVIFYNQQEIDRPRSGISRIFEKISIVVFDAIQISPIVFNWEKRKSLENRKYFLPFAIHQIVPPEDRNGPVNILCVGKFNPRKNLILFVQAIEVLARRYRIKANLVGEVSTLEQKAYYYEVLEYISDRGLGAIIVVTANVQYELLQTMYLGHDLFVLPASNEPASVSVLEALGAGMAVVCSDTCGTRCYVEEGNTGFVFKSDSLVDLVVRVEQAIKDRNNLNFMRRNAYQFSLTNLSEYSYLEALSEAVFKAWGIKLDQ